MTDDDFKPPATDFVKQSTVNSQVEHMANVLDMAAHFSEKRRDEVYERAYKDAEVAIWQSVLMQCIDTKERIMRYTDDPQKMANEATSMMQALIDKAKQQLARK